MTREWNPLWEDVVAPGNVDYTATVRRMIVASINWIEEHGADDLQWQERNIRAMLEAAGVPDDVPLEAIGIIAVWTEFFRPVNDITANWFKTMVEACEADGQGNTPSVYMMRKAIACGMMVSNEGFDNFNAFMCQRHHEEDGSSRPN